MIFGKQDYATLEREAWQKGDYRLAHVLAELCDAEGRASEAESRADEGAEEWQANYDHVQAAWEAHNTKMRQRLDNLRQLVEQAARVSGRELILERISEAEDLIVQAEENGS